MQNMSWFEEQIKLRKKRDEENLSDAIEDIASSVLHRRKTSFDNNRQNIKNVMPVTGITPPKIFIFKPSFQKSESDTALIACVIGKKHRRNYIRIDVCRFSFFFKLSDMV
jgi:hypothetical protein